MLSSLVSKMKKIGKQEIPPPNNFSDVEIILFSVPQFEK